MEKNRHFKCFSLPCENVVIMLRVPFFPWLLSCSSSSVRWFDVVGWNKKLSVSAKRGNFDLLPYNVVAQLPLHPTQPQATLFPSFYLSLSWRACLYRLDTASREEIPSSKWSVVTEEDEFASELVQYLPNLLSVASRYRPGPKDLPSPGDREQPPRTSKVWPLEVDLEPFRRSKLDEC